MIFRRINLKHAMLAITCIAFLFLACGNGGEEAYSDESDFNTTAVQTNIVQVETGASSPDWVKIYMVVTDQEGNPLQNFTVGNFAVMEFQTDSIDVDAGEITFDVFGGTAGGTIVTPLTMDYSGSMSAENITDMETACSTFVVMMQSQDRAEIIKFSDYVGVVQAFTSDKNLLIAAIKDSIWPSGLTALYDAVFQGIEDACPETGLRAVLAFTDGWENASTHTLADCIAEALSCGLGVYTVGLGSPDSVSLDSLARATGGRYYHAPTSQELADLYSLISGQLQNSYTLKWNIQSPSGTVFIIVTTTYTCGNGTFTSTAVGQVSY